MSDLKKLAQDAKDYSVLYAEDNDKLRDNVNRLLNKFFTDVDVTEDGKSALQLFNKKNYDIVITDIKMPNMDGIELAQNIKKINHETKVIIMSAFDDREYLLNSIELKVFRYLKKPVSINEFSDIIDKAIKEIKQEKNLDIFNNNLKNVFNYQSSIVVMLKDSTPVFANQMFLDYFNVKDIEEFLDKHENLSEIFLEHDGFLYQRDDNDWFEELKNNAQRLYNVKLLSKDGEYKHFILKYQAIPDKNSYGILSFDDITELNLLKLYDASQTKEDESIKDSKAMFKLIDVMYRNHAKIEIHNFYKGLTVTNDAIISDIDDDSITIKTKYLQQKAIQLEKKTIIISDALPYDIEASKIKKMSYENQTISLTDLKFIHSSAVNRKTVRVTVDQKDDDKQSVSLFLGDNKFHTNISIEDISLNAVKIKMAALPAGLEKGSEVTLDIVLDLDSRPIIINTTATLFSNTEDKKNYILIFVFDDFKKSELMKYIAKRQLDIIREFKGLQHG